MPSGGHIDLSPVDSGKKVYLIFVNHLKKLWNSNTNLYSLILTDKTAPGMYRGILSSTHIQKKNIYIFF